MKYNVFCGFFASENKQFLAPVRSCIGLMAPLACNSQSSYVNDCKIINVDYDGKASGNFTLMLSIIDRYGNDFSFDSFIDSLNNVLVHTGVSISDVTIYDEDSNIFITKHIN